MALLQGSPRVPAPSLAQGLFALNIPFGVKRIPVPICASRLLGKLYGSKKETLPSISAVFLAPEEMPSAWWLEQFVQV